MTAHSSLIFNFFTPFRADSGFKTIPSLEKFYKRFILALLIEQGLSFFVWQSGLMLLTLLLASVTFGEAMRILILFVLAGGSLYAATVFILKLKALMTLEKLCRSLESQSSNFKNLFSAVELSQMALREGISIELKRALIDLVQARLEKEAPERWIQFQNLKSLLKQLILLSMITLSLFLLPQSPLISGWNRLIFGAGKEFSRYIKIFPQGGQVVRGEALAVTAELLETDVPVPKFYVEGPIGWEEIAGETAGRKTSFQVKSITQPIKYKVRWRNLESPAYQIVPVELPRLSEFTVKILFPAYTGLPAQILRQEPQLQVFRGTKLEIEAQATKPLEQVELVMSNGMHVPVQLLRGKKVSVGFFVQNPFEFWFELKDADGLSPVQPPHYAIAIREDASPQVRLLAPSSDLLVGKESRIPFTYEVSDDMGVTALFLRILKGEETNPQRILLKKYQPPVKEKIDSVEFSLGSLPTTAGEILKLQLEAQDNDLVTGPKSGFSEMIFVEIQSYEKEHDQIEKELKEFRKNLVDLLADQTLARVSPEEWKRLSSNPDELNKKAGEILEKQSQIISKTEQVEKHLEKTLSKMERDPLSDFSIWSEHKAMQDALQSLRSGSMKESQKNISDKKFDEAVQEQDAAISELERLSTLSEDVHRYAKMKDLMHAADRLSEKGEELNQKLSAATALDEKLLRKLQETLKETAEILAEIQKQIQDLPQELPEDFVNQPAVKQLNLNELANAAQKLNQSLKSGDIQAAIRAAQDLLRRAKAARDAIAKAAEDVSGSSVGDLSKKSQAEQETLQKIVDQQEKLLEKTSRLESKRQKSFLEEQKNLLEKLAEKQRKVVNDSQVLLNQLNQKLPRPRFVNEIVSPLNAAIPQMKNVLREFEQKNAIFSQKWLQEIVRNLESDELIVKGYSQLNASVQKSTPIPENLLLEIAFSSAVEQKIEGLKVEEQSILDALKNPRAAESISFSKEDSAELEQLSQEQSRLAEETKKLRGAIAKIAERSALVKPELLDAMKNAQGEMRSAEKSLKNEQTGSAQGEQQKALSYLRKGQDGLEGVQEQLGQVRQMSGEKQTGFVQRRNQSGGQIGFRTGVVRIPGADEYLPPREFREELLDSLKERYPKSQEGIIKNYYKKLSQ